MGRRLNNNTIGRKCRSRYFRLDSSCTSFLGITVFLLVLEVIVEQCYTFGHNYHFNVLRRDGFDSKSITTSRLFLQKDSKASPGQVTNVPGSEVTTGSSSLKSRSTTSSTSSLFAGGVGEMMAMPMILVGVAAGASSVIGTITEAQRGGRPRFYPPPQRRRYFGDRDDREIPLYLPTPRRQQQPFFQQQRQLPMSLFVQPPPFQRQNQQRFLPQPLPPPAQLPLYDSPRGDGFYQNNDDDYDRYASERDRVYVDREPYIDRYDGPMENQRFRSSGGGAAGGGGVSGRPKSSSNDSMMNRGRDRMGPSSNTNYESANGPWGFSNIDSGSNNNMNRNEGMGQRRSNYDATESSYRRNNNYDGYGSSGSSSISSSRPMSNNEDRRIMPPSTRGNGMGTSGVSNYGNERGGPRPSNDGPWFSPSNSFSNYDSDSTRRPQTSNNNMRGSNTGGGWDQGGNDYSSNNNWKEDSSRGRRGINNMNENNNNYDNTRSSSRGSDSYSNRDMMLDSRAGPSSTSRGGGGGGGAPWYSSENSFTSYLDLSRDKMNNDNNINFSSNEYGRDTVRRNSRDINSARQDRGDYNDNNDGYSNRYNDNQMQRGTRVEGGQERMINERPGGMPYYGEGSGSRRMEDDGVNCRMRGSPVAGSPGMGRAPDRGQEMGPMSGPGISRGVAPGPGRDTGPMSGPGMSRGVAPGPGRDMGPMSGPGMNRGVAPGPGRDMGPMSGPGMSRGVAPGPGRDMGPMSGPGMNRGVAPGPGRDMGPMSGPGMNRGVAPGPGRDMRPMSGRDIGQVPGRDRVDYMENRNDMNRRGSEDYYSNSDSKRSGRGDSFGSTTSFAADPEPWYSTTNVRKNAFDDKSGGGSSSGGSSRSSFKNLGNNNNRNGGSSSSSRRWAVPITQQDFTSYHSHFFEDYDDFENHPMAIARSNDIHMQPMIDNGTRFFQQQHQYFYSPPANNFYFDNNFDDIHIPFHETMILLGTLEGKIRQPVSNNISFTKKSPFIKTASSDNVLDATIESKTAES